jgi:orotidine-5'-phosphate decarboxylase
VGATAPEELSAIRSLSPDLPLLIPGVGAQGGDLSHSIRVGNSSSIGIINVSRSISFAGDMSESAIRNSAESYVTKMNIALNGQ